MTGEIAGRAAPRTMPEWALRMLLGRYSLHPRAFTVFGHPSCKGRIYHSNAAVQPVQMNRDPAVRPSRVVTTQRRGGVDGRSNCAIALLWPDFPCGFPR